MVAENLLTSWRDTATRAHIVDFVRRVTTEGSPGYVAVADRVAVFDNDGTLWSEKPIPIQLDFTLYRMAELADTDPSLKNRQPYQAAAERDYRWLGAAMVKHYHGDDGDLHLLMAAARMPYSEPTSTRGRSSALNMIGRPCSSRSKPSFLHRPTRSKPRIR
jgi:hypothetical protein